MTRREFDQLREIYALFAQTTARLGDLWISAARDFAAEDAANTSLEQSSEVSHGDDGPV